MCRFAAYAGPELALERVIIAPSHSLLEQSQNATEAKLAVNGDGFGVAWYGAHAEPGLYREVLPAWSSSNLVDLCRMVSSPLFLAHVRASTVGETSHANCHPFRHGRWCFLHNGQLGAYRQIRRRLEQRLPDDLYELRAGSTDSELLFLTLIAEGLETDPDGAIARTLELVAKSADEPGGPNRITCAMSDGQTLYAWRSSSDGRSPTLYQGTIGWGTVLASEPLSPKEGAWRPIPDQTLVKVSKGAVTQQPLPAEGHSVPAYG